MTFEPGIYFGLDEEAYHAVPALSNSGIRNMLISPLDFWARSWMNPDYEPEETKFMETGKAYHKRILEGREAFYQCYAPALDPDDYPDALRTTEEIRARLRELDQKVGGNKPELIERLLEADAGIAVELWDQLVKDHASDHQGKQLLPFDLIGRIEICAAMIENHPELSKCFTGGFPEVSVFWESDGIPMKARLDYLKSQAIVDLKTFGNQLGKPVDRAIAAAMASGRYHVQAAVYLDSAAAAKRHIQEGRVHGCPDPSFLRALAASEQTFLFVFQQTGIAPVARGKVFPKGLVYDCAKITIQDAKRTFLEYREKFGDDPWVDQANITSFEDGEFPIYMTEA